MARQRQCISVCQVSKSSCKMFSRFMHSDVKNTDELGLSLKLSAVLTIVFMRCILIRKTLTLHSNVFTNLENPEGCYAQQTFW